MKNHFNKLAKAFAFASLPLLGGCITTGQSLEGFMRLGSTEPNDRVAVPYSSEWSNIGYLRTNDGNCTATLVAPNVILTADHCIKTRSGAQIALHNITFNIVRDRQAIDSSRIVSIQYPAFSASRTASAARDAVFLTLERPLGSTYGYDSIATSTPRANSNGFVPVQQLGYTSKYGYMRLTGDMSCQYNSRATRSGVLDMDCNVYKGDSGGPVFAAANNARGRLIVGVNSQARLGQITRQSYATSVIGMRPPTR